MKHQDNKNPQKNSESIQVDASGTGQRIDVWLSSKQQIGSRSFVKKLIDQEQILLNNTHCRSKDILKEGDQIKILQETTREPCLLPRKLPLDILFEDEHLIVINKPANLIVHPGAGHDATQTTLVEALLAHTSLCTQTQDKLRPGIVHRLDKDTTGVIICAKSIEAYESLSKQFLQKTNHREYLALLDGFMEKENLVHGSYLYRNPKNRLAFASCSKKQHETKSPTTSVKYRWAESSFHKVTTFGHRLTLASIRLHTGRTHQIRVHSKDLNLPVVGDPLYNRQHMLPQSFSKDITAQISSIGRQMLHAKSLGFEHPTTRKKLSFTAPLPEDFKNLLSSLKKYEN